MVKPEKENGISADKNPINIPKHPIIQKLATKVEDDRYKKHRSRL